MKRRQLFSAVILISAFFLVVLGMRNTSLSHNHGPKQRPRAVVENGCKASVEICCQQHLDAAPGPVIVLATFSEARPSYSHHAGGTPDPAPQFLNSRAPPSHLS